MKWALICGVSGKDGSCHVRVDSQLFRPTDLQHSKANLGKAREILGWRDANGMKEVVKNMIAAELCRP